jgi:hypothetical protein
MPHTPPSSAPGQIATGVCGPDVTQQIATVWSRIRTDFRSWSPDRREAACRRILIPLRMPDWRQRNDPALLVGSMADINGWDTLPLYQGKSAWLRRPPVYNPQTRGPCATPSSLDPSAPPLDDAHESPQTCSNTVSVRGRCWLNGTVNYGTFGIMVRLCRDEFPIQFRLALQMAQVLIRAYKRFGGNPEDATLPLAWLEATYHGGPHGVPSHPGNRPNCRCSCQCNAGFISWDYVWEPAKPRSAAQNP